MSDFLRLEDRALLITGASSGIGRATAVLANRAGARVVLVARRQEALEETASLLDGDGHHILPFDLSDHAGYAGLVRDAVEAVGPLDGLLHAAGVHATTPLRATSAKQVASLFETNVTSSVLLSKAFRNPKVRAERAGIVLMSSAVGLVGEAGVSVYAATKAAVSSLGRSLALELAPERIRVNSIAAGIVETSLTDELRRKVGQAAWQSIEAEHPLGIGSADDVANAALFLLSDASQWVTGTTLVVDGGYTAH
ncbi:SDR family NAD(P)-dependent oxidoreductase [Leucobacter chironomi]|uniref:SDR family NAD(P)-dependent oxidoreductase n=1 Tax=Leucobacter chironomi TaxID=491918 RepID=UPI000421B728|nr:SDR family NAD(P)-dependent oxidoreductase [Leucobacter chironomi]